MNCISTYYSTTWRTNCLRYLESKNRTCGFEGGDCCRNELTSEERLSTKLEIDCDPGLTCALMYPSPYAHGKCAQTRNYGSQIFFSLNHLSDFKWKGYFQIVKYSITADYPFKLTNVSRIHVKMEEHVTIKSTHILALVFQDSQDMTVK